ncbi:MAG TPA: UDP-N-acetylmuramoyl-tripeptide--D-alanyl-D-alanine ligase [Bryobacteraceae bacterium]|nr:UDP-N-acetylmuramoyl-tripeptide--D-alanyl-D-alanine ligase [Bryobacteraceae bacterium]
MTLTLEQIAQFVGAAPAAGKAAISGWSIDSRTVNPGDCFFALRGPTHDGHDYVASVFERGAALAIVDHEVAAAGPQIIVEDTTRALQSLGRGARQSWGGSVIGVTGSAGKTTTKETVAALVATEFPTGRNMGNLNNHLGLPLSILRLADNAKIAVLEMGMNHEGEIRDLAAIAHPQIGVVTNVGWAHTENFPDGIAGVARAKSELIQSLPREGAAVLNADDPRVREFRKLHAGRTILFGLAADAEVRAENVELSPQGARFRALGVDFESPLAGRHGVSNVLAGIAAARALGIAPERLRDAVRSLAPGKMRGEQTRVNGITIINDCYNANPEAMRSMLELLRDTPATRRIAVLGEMLELGPEAEALHRSLGRFVAEQGINAVIGIRGAGRWIVDEAIAAGLSGGAALFFKTPEEAGEYLKRFLKPGDAVLFKGSRGVRVERALEGALAEETAGAVK